MKVWYWWPPVWPWYYGDRRAQESVRVEARGAGRGARDSSQRRQVLTVAFLSTHWESSMESGWREMCRRGSALSGATQVRAMSR